MTTNDTTSLLMRADDAWKRHQDFRWTAMRPADVKALADEIRSLQGKLAAASQHTLTCASCEAMQTGFSLIAQIERSEARGDIRNEFARRAKS
jgi:hypothetical protein